LSRFSLPVPCSGISAIIGGSAKWYYCRIGALTTRHYCRDFCVAVLPPVASNLWQAVSRIKSLTMESIYGIIFTRMRIKIDNIAINDGEELLLQLGEYDPETKTITLEKRVIKEVGIRHFAATLLHEITHYILDILHIDDDETLAENVERIFLRLVFIKHRYFD